MKRRRMVSENVRGGEGSALVVILMVIAVLLAFSAGLTMMSLAGLRSVSESEENLKCFYIADSGAQDGIARIRASQATLNPTSFNENLGGGQAQVVISKPNSGFYQITSTGTYSGKQKAVEVYVKVSGNFGLEGAIAVNFGNGIEFEGANIPIQVDPTAAITGMNHSAAGALLADQSAAVYGLSTNPVAGGKNFSISGGGTVQGSPAPTTNQAAGQQVVLSALWNYARASADVMVNGSATWGTAQTGSFGTAADPKLVYVKLNDHGTLTMDQAFAGYGTLVVEISEFEENTALKMLNSASWNGLVLAYVRHEAEVRTAPFALIQDTAKIVGGLAMYFNTEEMEFEGSGKLVSALGSAQVLYSSDLVSNAKGLSQVVSKSLQVTSYRLP